jgi:hypothetical protein
VESTTDEVLTAVQGINRADGVPVVDRIYMDGEVMIGAKANQDWFLTTHYPRFVSRVSAAGFQPSVYFIVADTQADLLDSSYIDTTYPILNNHRSMFWMYRSLKSWWTRRCPSLANRLVVLYFGSLRRALRHHYRTCSDDGGAVLPTLGAARSYFFAETSYFQDDTERRALGQAIAGQAVRNPSRMTGVCFWTTPAGGGTGINIAYPFAIEDYFPPPGP